MQSEVIRDERIPVTRILGQQAEREIKSGWVYLLNCGVYTKIGRSESKPKERRGACQAGSPYKIKTTGQYFVQDYKMVEKSLHSVFKKKKVRGEWFKLNAIDLQWIHRHLAELCKNKEASARKNFPALHKFSLTNRTGFV